jgi:hypothetical protein
MLATGRYTQRFHEFLLRVETKRFSRFAQRKHQQLQMIAINPDSSFDKEPIYRASHKPTNLGGLVLETLIAILAQHAASSAGITSAI